MAALENIFNHARRHCTWRPPAPISTLLLRTFSSSHSSRTFDSGLRVPHLIISPSSCSTLRSPFVGFYRSFSSSEDPPETPAATSKQTVPIKPVSYTVKPKDPPSPSSTPGEEEVSEKHTTPEFQRKRETVRTATFRTRETDSEGAANAEPRPWTREDIRYVKDIRPISPVSYPSRVAPLPEDKVSAQAEEDVGEGSRRENEQLERERKKIETDARIRSVLRAEEEKVLPFPTLIKVEKKKPKVVLELQEAIREIKANAKRNFDETVEAHVNLGVDPRRGDQMVRGATTLPHGTGKIVRVAVFAEGAAADEARAAGADIVGGDELIEEIRKGGAKLSFDKCISTPMFMPRLGKIAKILGPRGLMPNPKLGSVTTDVTGAVRGAKHGRIDFKIDKTAIVHVGLGKVSFSEESIRENVGAFMNALLLAKPVGLKKTSKYAGYVNSFTLCSTMGPGFPISIQSLSIAADHYNRLQLK